MRLHSLSWWGVCRGSTGSSAGCTVRTQQEGWTCDIAPSHNLGDRGGHQGGGPIGVVAAGWKSFSIRDHSLAIVLLSPTACTESTKSPETELAFWISLSSLLLSAVVPMSGSQSRGLTNCGRFWGISGTRMICGGRPPSAPACPSEAQVVWWWKHWRNQMQSSDLVISTLDMLWLSKYLILITDGLRQITERGTGEKHFPTSN